MTRQEQQYFIGQVRLLAEINRLLAAILMVIGWRIRRLITGQPAIGQLAYPEADIRL